MKFCYWHKKVKASHTVNYGVGGANIDACEECAIQIKRMIKNKQYPNGTVRRK